MAAPPADMMLFTILDEIREVVSILPVDAEPAVLNILSCVSCGMCAVNASMMILVVLIT